MEEDEAFGLLGEVVRQGHELGRRLTAAGVKVRMRGESPGFDEKLLGYTNFRAFLEDACGRNVVATHTGGVDLLVTPAGAQPPDAEPATPQPALAVGGRSPAAGPSRVRRDLWKAFVDWTPGLMRLYDRQEDTAFTLPTRPGPRELPEHRERRDSVERDPGRFISIEPIPFDDQLRWMHEFAEMQEQPTKTQLQLALGSDRPARDFTGRIRNVPALREGWHGYLVDRVAKEIRRWADRHEIHPTVFGDENKVGHAATPPPGAAPPASYLRAALHRAIDRMPEHELMAIKVPVGYLVDSPETR